MTVELSDDNGAYQVADDVELLDLMLDDLAAAAPVFQPPACRAHELPLVAAEDRKSVV